MDIAVPDDFFDPQPGQDKIWPDDPELRRAVNWFKSFIPEKDWIARRKMAAKRLYTTAALGRLVDSEKKGRFFSDSDVFGWYLFQAEALLDHFWNYEPIYGARIIPVFCAIGRNLPILERIDGIDARVRRLVGVEKRQPNGGLFELLVAGAYSKLGARVEFIKEIRGACKVHDMDVWLNGRKWAVECKRMETCEYSERERARIRKLWGPSNAWLSHKEISVFCDANFSVEIDAVPDNYLSDKVQRWLAFSRSPFRWDDEIGSGSVEHLDLQPLQTLLSTDIVLGISPKMLQLLTGRYIRNASYIWGIRCHPSENPRFVDHCDLAILLRWESRSPASIDWKARDIMKRLSEATKQLPENTPSIVHVGFEAVDGDFVEKARYEKILETTRHFDPGTKQLEYVYCHYFVPESPPDENWAYDETTQWCGIRPNGPHPLGHSSFLVIPDDAKSRRGTHWQI